jgi:hypothetical protein
LTNSTCSTPSFAIRKATRLPFSSSAIFRLLSRENIQEPRTRRLGRVKLRSGSPSPRGTPRGRNGRSRGHGPTA